MAYDEALAERVREQLATSNVNGGWVGAGAKRPGGHECRLEWLLAHRDDTRRATTNVVSTPVCVVETTFVASRRLAPDSYPAAVAVRWASTIHVRTAARAVEPVI